MAKQIKDYTLSVPGSTSTTDLYVMQKESTGETVKVQGINLLGPEVITYDKIDWSTAGGIWWQELGRSTLTADTTTTTLSFTGKKYLCIMAHVIGASTGDTSIRFNSDTAANYSNRYSNNGAADATSVSATSIIYRHGLLVNGGSQMTTGYVVNIAAQEKLVKYASIGTTTGTGGGNAPGRLEGVGKWANTTDLISSVTLFCSGNMGTGTSLIVLGHD